MVFSSKNTVILYVVFIIINVANGFSNTGVNELTTRHNVYVPRGTLQTPVHTLQMTNNVFQSAAACDANNNINSRFSQQLYSVVSKESRGSRMSQPWQLFSSSSYSMESSSSRARKTTAVYALILASVFAFIGDNILHLSIFRTMYLHHRKWRWWQPITSTFCHGDSSHLSGNVFLLLLFGRSVEDELGAAGLICSYIFCGIVANLVSLMVLPKKTISIGASGAVFGLFSVSIVSRMSWKDILDWRKIIEVGVLGQFVVKQFLNEAKTAASGGIVGVNHIAHLSGAGAGVAMILILRKLINIMEKRTNTK